MRREDLTKLETPYQESKTEIDRRFHTALEADVPSANILVREILGDLDRTTYGIPWLTGITDQERVLISDYLYQCAYAIETNLVEANLHILEWFDARDHQNRRIADVVQYEGGEFKQKMPPALAPIDDLPARLGDMHVCGFFQAIGSSLDCLSAVVVGVLGLKSKLRRCDIGKMEQAFNKIPADGSVRQVEFPDFYEAQRKDAGPDDWLNWTNQMRNMLIHRGRRIIYHSLVQRCNPLLDSKGKTIMRSDATMHLPKDPDRSDVEAWIKDPNIVLSEDAGITLTGIFKSCRQFHESICERLVTVYRERRTDPPLITQPASQWDLDIRESSFEGYEPPRSSLDEDNVGMSHGTVLHRMISAAVMDQQRTFWEGSPYVTEDPDSEV